MTPRFAHFHAAILGLAVIFGAVTATAQPVTEPAPPVPVKEVSAAAPTAYVGSDYRLGPGDKIRLIVFGEEALSGQFVVSGNGKVSLPLIGEVNAANLTVPQFQDEVDAALRQGYLKEPRVSAEVLTYRPFYILGEVRNPGEYPYSSGLTVLNAVATAGGFTYRAQTKRVFIRRHSETEEKSYELKSETSVAPGDTIRIGERFF
jgi:polysaccharide export outer membrane protein